MPVWALRFSGGGEMEASRSAGRFAADDDEALAAGGMVVRVSDVRMR